MCIIKTNKLWIMTSTILLLLLAYVMSSKKTIVINKTQVALPVQTKVITLEIDNTVTTDTVEEIEDEPVLSEADIDLVAKVVMAEAGGQEMIGKVAVASTILNRCDKHNMSVEEVIEGQYASEHKGIVTADCNRAVRIALLCRDLFPNDMYYFRAEKYHSFGKPYLQIQDHYFSTEGETE